MKARKISDTERLKKNQAIKESLKKTRAKRESQQAVVLIFKVSKNKNPKNRLYQLGRPFVEKKWIKNWCIG